MAPTTMDMRLMNESNDCDCISLVVDDSDSHWRGSRQRYLSWPTRGHGDEGVVGSAERRQLPGSDCWPLYSAIALQTIAEEINAIFSSSYYRSDLHNIRPSNSLVFPIKSSPDSSVNTVRTQAATPLRHPLAHLQGLHRHRHVYGNLSPS